MCLWVEMAHHQQLIQNVRETLSELRDLAPERARDMLFDLPPRIAAAAIIFRDFPKRHGNIIQRAVGIALEHHPGGIAQTAARFKFLSGLHVEIDNFFMTRRGQIHLFETKRDYNNVREEGVAGRNLSVVKRAIEATVLAQTGKKLRYPIGISYFSYADEKFDGKPRPHRVNIGSQSTPQWLTMPIYSREDMSNLIGPCFGEYLRMVDIEIGTAIAEVAPDLRAQVQQAAEPVSESAEPFLVIGEQPSDWDVTLGDLLD
jgi:hypothetical protein